MTNPVTDITLGEIEALIDREVVELCETFKHERGEVLATPQFHLHAEYLLERLIRGKLERGDKLLEQAGLTFHQKLCLVESFEIVNNHYIDALRKVNRLRNNCAHVKAAAISAHDLEQIGQCLGVEYSMIKKSFSKAPSAIELMTVLFGRLGAHLISRSIGQEYRLIDGSLAEKPQA